VTPTDGKTVETACWVRRVEGEQFQVFAINCAHLGCPVRWFPQSGLFMCPCHGGAYYRDGSRASGPPERGLFEYPYKVQDGVITIQTGELPTPGSPTASLSGKKPPCAARNDLVPRNDLISVDGSKLYASRETNALPGEKKPWA
jgi:nitrite reductase/ring-hydroxylating ferredoxin subunit